MGILLRDAPSHLGGTQAVLRRTRRSIRRRRRGLSALCLGLSVLFGLMALRPPAPTTAAVVVVTDHVPSGAVLTREVLGTVRYPPSLVPDQSMDSVDGVVGLRTTLPLAPGEVITEARLLTGEALRAVGSDMVAVPVGLPAPLVSLVKPGDRVDLLRTPAPFDAATGVEGRGSGSVVGQALTVLLATPGTDSAAHGSVVLAVPYAIAADVASAGVSGLATVMIHPR